jgi:hypothetical protein
LAEMTTRERFQAVMNFRPFDRLPIVEWAIWWNHTIDRWRKEGLPSNLTDRYDICRHFGLDMYFQHWFRACAPDCPEPMRHGGGIISSAEDYEKIRDHLYPRPLPNHRELWERWTNWAELQKRGDAVLWFTLEGFFWFPRTLLGIERHLYAFYDQAELMHRINADLAEWHVNVIEELVRICKPDFMTFAEDMSYNHGPMLSRDLFDEFIAPYYRRVVPLLKDNGIITVVDSDGDITVPAAWFENVGVEGMLPLERQAGVDVAGIRKLHPRMRFIGCFDKMTMHRGEAAMRHEFERLIPTAASGGLIISCDHQTPPGVSYADYRLYLRLFREYADKAGDSSRQSTA